MMPTAPTRGDAGLRVRRGPITVERERGRHRTLYRVSSSIGEEITKDLVAALRRHGLHPGDIHVAVSKVRQWGRLVAGASRDPRDRQMGLFD